MNNCRVVKVDDVVCRSLRPNNPIIYNIIKPILGPSTVTSPSLADTVKEGKYI